MVRLMFFCNNTNYFDIVYNSDTSYNNSTLIAGAGFGSVFLIVAIIGTVSIFLGGLTYKKRVNGAVSAQTASRIG